MIPVQLQFGIVTCAAILFIHLINSYKDYSIYQSSVDEISFISGYVTSSCKHLNTTECKELISWGQQLITKLNR